MVVTNAERERLMSNASVKTLNGQPAMIVGRLEDFATVWAFSGQPGQPIEAVYAWETVRHTIDYKGGIFTK